MLVSKVGVTWIWVSYMKLTDSHATGILHAVVFASNGTTPYLRAWRGDESTPISSPSQVGGA